ncbi:hypothetical protein L486_08050 [Kwoniella mangroviensis CBS 10435]|uniref:Uncharacterized protein n=1 Tax=Kwoniella mangroviensis CBS 10435 TaxID=1331196 RepID=A0A1B9IGE2_9TREE|nr:uncharacterized protein I203_00996 [Kwoniella mangroviensis CBS 8507]OCF54501.1 hypothetical protein L486_08050 [Kwoniella mangroviensis CBS 10435]OCF69143.1 hypothetical protein I203_00996 [Kwoniella mangroviensis CBS 8507]
MTVPDTNSNSPNNSNGLDPSESPPMLNGDRPNGKPTSQEVVILPSSFLLLICIIVWVLVFIEILILYSSIGYSDDASFCVSAFQTIFFILSLISIYAAFFEPGLEFEGRTTDPQWKFREKNWLIFFAKVGLVMNAMHGFMLCKEITVFN